MSVSYVSETGFRAYVDYLALKRHFTEESYDYIKYNGKIRASFQSFEKRRDAYFFEKLGSKKEYHNLLLANILENPKFWIGDIVSKEGEDRYFDWKKRMDSLTYTFENDLSKLEDTWSDNFLIKQSGVNPRIFQLYSRKEISLESFTILSKLSNSFEYWKENLNDKIIAGDVIKKSLKYLPFIDYDEKKYRSIVKDRFF